MFLIFIDVFSRARKKGLRGFHGCRRLLVANFQVVWSYSHRVYFEEYAFPPGNPFSPFVESLGLLLKGCLFISGGVIIRGSHDGDFWVHWLRLQANLDLGPLHCRGRGVNLFLHSGGCWGPGVFLDHNMGDLRHSILIHGVEH